jgi:hypothetical protein
VSRLGERTPLECAGIETDAAQLWIRRDKGSGAVRKVALADATRLTASKRPLLAADGIRAVNLSFQPDGIRGWLECAGDFRLRVLAAGFTRARLDGRKIAIRHDGEIAVIVGRAEGLLHLSLTR